MRNLLVVILLAVAVWFSGFFIVDQRQVGVVYLSAAEAKVYAPGVHWKMPFVGELSLVYTNSRSAYVGFANTLTTANHQQFNTGVVINWQVVEPANYIRYLQKNSSKILDANLSLAVEQQLTKLAAASHSVHEFEELLNRTHNLSLPEMGIKVVDVAAVSVILKPQVVLASIATADNLLASYQYAQQLKQAADQQQARQLASLAAKDGKFYRYFMQINTLHNQVVSKQQVPPLNKLYSN